MKYLFWYLVMISANVHAQTVTYFDADWQETSKSKATFYRETTIDNKGAAEVTDYFITGEKQMKGTYRTKDLKVKEGNFVYYHANGKISSKGKYSNNVRSGKWLWFYDTGRLEEEGAYDRKGKQDGTWQAFYPDGKNNYKGLYKNGRKVKEWRYWHTNGQLAGEEYWEANVTTKADYYSLLGAPCKERCGTVPMAYKGGKDALFNYVKENNKYPPKAKLLDEQPSGTVWIKFKVTETGKIEDVTVRDGVHPILDEQAKKVVEGMPDWLPAKDGNRTVARYTELPFYYVLNKDE